MWLAAALGIAVHRGTLLRLVLGLPDPAASAAPDGSASTTSRCAAATSTPRPRSTLPPDEPSTCCPAGAYAEGARDGPRRGPGR